jgi:Xaa-Pro aminopeptidase
MAKAQAKLITNKTNIAYLANFTGSAGFMLLTKNKSYLFTDSRYVIRAKNSLNKGVELVDITRVWRNKKELQEHWSEILQKHRVKTLGVEEENMTMTKFKWFKKISKVKGKQVKFIDVSGEIEKTREIKSKKEIGMMKKSQEINEKVFKAIKKVIQDFQKGKTRAAIQEIDLAQKIKELGGKFGAEDVSFDPIVGFGKNSASVHHNPGKTKLKKNDIVLIDMGMKYKGYCSDMSRMILPPKPSEKMKEIYKLVLKAQLAGCKGVKAGISGAAADKLSREVIEEAGYGEFYSHSGGHGVGLDIHETPNLSKKFKGKLKENSVITIEPGIYLPGKFGVRIEDMVLVKKNGNKNLTRIKK